MSNAWADVRSVDAEIETYLAELGQIFRAFREQDSGNVAYGVLLPDGAPSGGERWFVKHASKPRAIASLLLLGDGKVLFDGWVGTEAMKQVVQRATDPDRERRYPSVRAFVDAWRATVAE